MEGAEEKLESFFSQFRRLAYKKQEVILRADDTPSSVYYIFKGYIRLYSISETGQELTLILLKPGDFFPLRWAITGENNTYACDTITNAEVGKVPRDKFIEFIQANPDVVYELLSKVLVRLGGLLERMEYLVFGNAYQKVASILVICAERFGSEKGKKILIKVPLTHKDIANLIGLTRETTSLELKKLENLGVCEKEGRHMIINNLEKLKNEANWYKFV